MGPGPPPPIHLVLGHINVGSKVVLWNRALDRLYCHIRHKTLKQGQKLTITRWWPLKISSIQRLVVKSWSIFLHLYKPCRCTFRETVGCLLVTEVNFGHQRQRGQHIAHLEIIIPDLGVQFGQVEFSSNLLLVQPTVRWMINRGLIDQSVSKKLLYLWFQCSNASGGQ